jgi:hypothetical protein
VVRERYAIIAPRLAGAALPEVALSAAVFQLSFLFSKYPQRLPSRGAAQIQEEE